jgi:cobalt-zinc-cadmium efflux system outer membrane protein
MKLPVYGLALALCTSSLHVHASDDPPPESAQRATPAAQSLSLPELLRLVLSQSPRLKAQRAGVAVAAAERRGAELLPNPTLAYDGLVGLHEPAYVNGTQHQVSVSQPLLVWGQREQRRRAAESGIKAASAAADLERAELARQVREGFAELLAARARVAVWQDAELDLQRAREVVRARVQSGVMSEYDALRMDIEMRGLQAELKNAEAELEALRGQLASDVALPTLRVEAQGELLPVEVALPAAKPVPSEVLAKAEESAAGTQIELARRNARPVPVVGVGAMFTTSGYTLAANLGLSLDLPLFDRGQGAIARAEAIRLQYQRVGEAARASVSAERTRAEQLLRERTQNALRYDADLPQQLAELRRMGDAAYKSGSGGILNLLDTERSITAARLKQVDLHVACALARIDSLAARGLSDSLLP